MHEVIFPNHYNNDIFIVTKKTSPSNLHNLQKLNLPIKIENSKPISLARKLCLVKTTKDFVLFIDDDIFVSNIVFEQLSKHMKGDVGAVEGIPLIRGFGKWFNDAINKYHISCELKKGEGGFTIITLVRKSLASDWAPPLLTSYEDYALSQHILSKGFKWIKILVLAIHDKKTWKVTLNVEEKKHYRNGIIKRSGLLLSALETGDWTNISKTWFKFLKKEETKAIKFMKALPEKVANTYRLWLKEQRKWINVDKKW